MSLISVVIPAYNAASTLPATLNSVLSQTYGKLEIIVVDDGSTDTTADVVRTAAAKDGRVRLLQRRNEGVAAARNAGIAKAEPTADWIAPLDADDLWHPEKLERQLAAAAAAPWSPVFVYSWSRRIDGGDRVLFDFGRPRHRGDVFAALMYSNFLNNASSPLIQRNALNMVGGFDSGLQRAGAHGAEDLQLYLRLADIGPVEVAPGFLVGYRSTPGAMSSSAERMNRSIDLVLDEAERIRPEMPMQLRRAARMKYDLYIAGLTLRSGSAGGCAQFIGRGLRRAPLMGTIELASTALEMAASSVFRAAPRFQDLLPDRDLRPGSARWMDQVRAVAVRRAISRAPLCRSRWYVS